jgi:hypothetical protein
LNDKGRVEVGDKLGSTVDKVEGMLTAETADSYTLAVSQVFQLGGNSSKWSGEPVSIAKDGTIGYQVHRFNQTRTVVLTVAIVVAVVVVFATTKLNGGGTDQPTTGGCPSCQTQRVHP